MGEKIWNRRGSSHKQGSRVLSRKKVSGLKWVPKTLSVSSSQKASVCRALVEEEKVLE